MSFTVAQALRYHYDEKTDKFLLMNREVKARKSFTDNVKDKSYEWGVCTYDTPAGQPFWEYEHLCEGFAKDLCALDDYEEPLVLLRGKQTKVSNTKAKLVRTSKDFVLDVLSRFFIFDVDYFSGSPALNASTGLLERLQLYLEERAPFLEGKKVIIMGSSSLGVEYVIDKGVKVDLSKRMSIRVFVEFDREYTVEEVVSEIGEYLFKGTDDEGNEVPEVADGSYRKHIQKTYIQRATLVNTKDNFSGPRALFVDGEPLTFDEVKAKGVKRNIKTSSVIVEETLHYVADMDMAEKAKAIVEKAEHSENKWDYFNELFKQMYFYKPDQVAPLVKEIEENQTQIYGQTFTPEKLRNIKGVFENITLNNLLCHNAGLRGHFKKQLNLNSIDLSKEIKIVNQGIKTPIEFVEEHIINQKYLCFASDCGTAKTKGVIKHLIDHCKATGKSLLYIANTTAIVVKQAEEFGINSYHKNGTEVSQKKSVIQASQQLTLCYRSLHYYKDLDLADWNYDYLIIDEASQVLRGWQESLHKTNDEMQWLFGLADKASHVHLYDADIDDELCSWFLTELTEFKSQHAAFYVNNAKRAEGYQIAVAKTQDIALKELLDSLERGEKVCVFINDSDDNGRMSGFIDYIDRNTEIDINSLCYDGKTQKDELLKDTTNFLSSKLKGGLNLLVLNAWAGIGFDYFHPEEHFDSCFIIDSRGWLTPKTIWQFLRRMRTVRKGLVYSNFSNDLALSYRRQKLLVEHKAIDTKDFDRLEKHLMKAMHCHEMDKAKARFSFMSQAEMRGAVLSELNDVDNEEYEGHSKRMRDQIRDYQERKGFADSKQAANIDKVCDKFWKLDENWREPTFEELMTDHNKLSQEYDLMNSAKAKRILEISHMTEEERLSVDSKYLNEINAIIGDVLEEFVRLAFRGAENSLKSFLEWYLYDLEVEYLQNAGGLIDQDDAKVFLEYLTKYKYLLPDDLKIPRDSFKTPTKAIRALAGHFGLRYESAERVLVKDVQAELFAVYQKDESLKNFPMGRNVVNKRKAFVKDYLKNKENLTSLEEEYLKTFQNPYRLYRKDYITKEYYKLFERILDKLGDTFEVVEELDEMARRREEFLKAKADKKLDRKNPRGRPAKQIAGGKR